MKMIHKNSELASKFLKGLANKNRLVVLCALAEGEKNVSELEKILGIRQPTLSQQLARLRVDNLVSTRRESKQIFYSIASDEAELLLGLLFKLFCKGRMWTDRNRILPTHFENKRAALENSRVGALQGRLE